jgi:hypothetical protein
MSTEYHPHLDALARDIEAMQALVESGVPLTADVYEDVRYQAMELLEVAMAPRSPK